jgi:hypothetical protein
MHIITKLQTHKKPSNLQVSLFYPRAAAVLSAAKPSLPSLACVALLPVRRRQSLAILSSLDQVAHAIKATK